ncbi:MAG: mechanosensitive ion channel [Bacteroidia bacterium]|nr:mechanosensitive ion channel [Bacteroidia bacterium]
MQNFTNWITQFLSFTGMNESVSTVLAALIILFIGWLIAKTIRKVVYKILKKTSWDEKLLGKVADGVDFNVLISKIIYYLLMIIVLMTVLEAMGLTSVLDPIKGMLDEFLGFIPNLIAASLIGFVGYIIATFVANLISVTGNFMDKIAEKAGFKDADKLVNIIKQFVFIIIFIPFLIQALNSLQLNAITAPANEILSSIFGIIPNVLGAAAVIAIFVIGGKFLTGFLKELLTSMGVDSLSEKIQLTSVIGENQSLSKIISGILFYFLVFFGIITGVEMLELHQLTSALNSILTLSGQILFGLVILVLGNFIGSMIYNSLSKSDDNKFIASIVRVAIIGLFLAMSLRTMGIANSIVELAFGLTLGAVAIAVALSYGLGGRDAAGEHMKDILGRFRKN